MRIAQLAVLLCSMASVAQAETWRIATVDGRAALGTAEIAFGDDGSIAGSAGCNRFTGAGRMEAGALLVGSPLAITEMACPDEGLAAQEAAVLDALRGSMRVVYDPFTGQLDLVGEATSLGLTAETGDGGPTDAPGLPASAYVDVFGLSGRLNIRAEPSTGAPVVARVRPGALLRNRGCREDADRAWCEVKLLDAEGTAGWAAAEYLQAAPASLRAGQAVFDRIGRISCTLAEAEPSECEAGVARDPDGTAVVVVYRSGGTERTLSFEGARFVASDTSEVGGGYDATASREGDAISVTVDGERFDVPLTFLTGA